MRPTKGVVFLALKPSTGIVRSGLFYFGALTGAGKLLQEQAYGDKTCCSRKHYKNIVWELLGILRCLSLIMESTSQENLVSKISLPHANRSIPMSINLMAAQTRLLRGVNLAVHMPWDCA